MGIPATPISRGISWAEVLSALEVPVDSNVLPATFRCPNCGAEKLTVYNDFALGGVWLHCRQCCLAGDVVEYAAKCWECDVETALKKLEYLGVDVPSETLIPERIKQYANGHVGRRRRINEFWGASRLTLAQEHTGETRQLVRQLTGIDHCTRPDWLDRGGRYIGASRRIDVERCLFPGATEYRARSGRNGHGAGGRSVFRGGGWDHLLVIPFWDFPGRISGFLFVGRGGNSAEGDFVFKRVLPPRTGVPRQEAGLQMIDNVFERPDPSIGDTMVVIPDPAIALRLQLKHLTQWSYIPLPIVGTYEDERVRTTRCVWSQLPVNARDLVFLVPEIDARVLAAARDADAKICAREISRRELEVGMTHRQPSEWVHFAKRHARPWKSVMRELLRRQPLHEAEALLLKMGFSWKELRDFVWECDENLRSRLIPILEQRSFRPHVRLAGKTISAAPDGWYLEPAHELIADATVRIERVIQTDRAHTIYSGHIRFRGEEIPFDGNAREIERGLLLWARDYLLNAGKGLMTYEPSWSKKALSLALQLHPPEFVEATVRIGWDPKHCRFQFPKFSINLIGGVEEGCPLVVATDKSPAANSDPPDRLYCSECEALSQDSYEIAIFWAVAACVLSNLLAAARTYPPAGIALVGTGAQSAGRVAARLLGCIETRMPLRDPVEPAVDRLLRVTNEHDWPTMLIAPAKQAACIRRAWLQAPYPKNCLMNLDPRAAHVVAISGGWSVIRCDRAPGYLQTLNEAGPKVVPAYFMDLAKRRFQIDNTHGCRALDVLADMGAWFKRCGGDESAVQKATTVLTADGQDPVWRHFVNLVREMNRIGELPSLRGWEQKTNKDASATLDLDDDGPVPNSIWIPQQGTSQAIAAKSGLGLDVPAVARSLAEEGVLLEERELRGQMGWVLPGKWWFGHLFGNGDSVDGSSWL